MRLDRGWRAASGSDRATEDRRHRLVGTDLVDVAGERRAVEHSATRLASLRGMRRGGHARIAVAKPIGILR